jgi:ubiquinone/menaquinone biosynthesis C-methylase UbiE
VVEFSRSFTDRPHSRILDLGCGAGRHLVFLEKEGFRIEGLDNARNGLVHARQWLQAENLSSKLVQADMESLPFASDVYDGLICIQVIFHNILDGIKNTINEIHRVMRSGGQALLTFHSPRSYRFGRGIELEPSTYIPEIGGDAGVPHHFSSIRELAELLEDFIVKKIELIEFMDDNQYQQSIWLVHIQKE